MILEDGRISLTSKNHVSGFGDAEGVERNLNSPAVFLTAQDGKTAIDISNSAACTAVLKAFAERGR